MNNNNIPKATLYITYGVKFIDFNKFIISANAKKAKIKLNKDTTNASLKWVKLV
jgi:hypothetical protein